VFFHIFILVFILHQSESIYVSSVPFTLPDAGLREVAGTIYLENDLIILEIETTLMGEWDPENKTIEIEPGALVEVRHERGFFRDGLVLRPRKRDLLSVVPGSHKEALKLKIKKRYREAAASLATAIQRMIV